MRLFVIPVWIYENLLFGAIGLMVSTSCIDDFKERFQAFIAHCAPKGSAFRFCVTFCCSPRPQRECIPLMRYLLLLPVPQKGVPRVPKGSATPSCVTFCCSPRPQRECILLLRYLSLLTVPQKGVISLMRYLSLLPAPPKGVHSAHALPFAAH